MRPAWAFVAFLGCGGSNPPHVTDPQVSPSAKLADDDQFVPTYGKAELQRTLIAERGVEATGERQVREIEALVAAGSTQAGSDRLRVALGDLAVRRRFISTLEACESQGQWCPPRLDDPPWMFDAELQLDAQPPLDAPLRFDIDGWRAVAAELHGRACACRTMRCIESFDTVIETLEKRPMPAVQGDDAASLSVTRARECLFRLRGKKPFRATPVPSE